jgi:tetratricopeptide (TPR) repeat protein
VRPPNALVFLFLFFPLFYVPFTGGLFSQTVDRRLGGPLEFYEKGAEALGRGHLYEAIDGFKESIAGNPDYVLPLAGLAEAYFKLGQYEQALVYVERARLLARNDYRIAVLEGRIHTGLGNYDTAERLFQELLKKQPYNQEVSFGLAELNVAMGNIENALASYRRALESDPYNRRGLLSAALLYSEKNKVNDAAELIRTALDSYPEDPEVHAFAARFYLENGERNKAELHAAQAAALDAGNADALMVMVELLLSEKRYSEAVDALDRSMGLDRRNHLLWYLRGLSLSKTGATEQGMESFYTALNLRPDDEVSRLVMEAFLLEEYSPNSEERMKAAEVRFETGKAYERDNRVELARQEYRRGLMLDPYSREGRVLYAGTFKRTENLGKYLSVLEVLEREGSTTQAIEDEIEIYRNLRENSVAEEWGIDQFAIERFRYRFAVFTKKNESELVHLGADVYLSGFVKSLMQAYESMEIVAEGEVESFAEAFRSARERNADFFVLAVYGETERSFSLSLEVYNAESGVLLETFSGTRTGNNRITQSLVRAVDSVNSVLPVRGNIFRRRGNEVLVDIGKFQGLETESILLVIRQEDLKRGNDSFNFEYSEEDLLGQIELVSVDDLLAAGTVRTYQFFDLINPGDAVIPMPKTKTNPSPGGGEKGKSTKEVPSGNISPPGDMYRSLIGIN